MAYTPPQNDAVNLDLTGAYTAPASDAVDLQFGAAPVLIEIDCPAFGNTSALDTSGALLQIVLADLESDTSLSMTTTRRIPLLNFEQASAFGPEFIAEVPEGTTAVGTWPFESNTSLDKPNLAYILEAEFNQDSNFSTPIIIANDLAEIVAEDFETLSVLSVDIMPAVTVFDFESPGQLDILAITSAPAGDQYTVCPVFAQDSEFETPAFLEGLPLPDFEQGTALVVESIFNGIVVSPATFDIVSDLNATPYPGVYLADFESYQALESDIMPAIFVPNFEQSSELYAGIYAGIYAEIPEFNSRITFEAGLSFGIQSPDFEQNSALDGFDITEFIIAPEFNVSGELLVDKIGVFTLENSQIRYFLTITGAADGLEDVQIPFTSFQARRRSGADTYLQAVVPSTEFIDQITARANGTMRIDQAYTLGGEVIWSKIIIETTMDQVNPYEGGGSDTLVLIGYKTTTYTPKTVEISDATYRAQIDGKLSYRLPAPDLFLNPGDQVVIGADEFTLGVMSYTVSGSFQQIDLTEA